MCQWRNGKLIFHFLPGVAQCKYSLRLCVVLCPRQLPPAQEVLSLQRRRVLALPPAGGRQLSLQQALQGEDVVRRDQRGSAGGGIIAIDAYIHEELLFNSLPFRDS